MDIQKRIQQLTDERGQSEYRLSKNSNLSQTIVANIFKGSSVPALPTLEVTYNVFGIMLVQSFSDGSGPIELTEQRRELFRRWSALNEAQKEILFDLTDHM